MVFFVGGGRTRTRTSDPLIESQLVIWFLLNSPADAHLPSAVSHRRATRHAARRHRPADACPQLRVVLRSAQRDTRTSRPALTGEKKRKASLIERVRIFQILDRMLAFLSALRPRRMEIPRNWVLIDKSVSDRLPTASNSASHEAPPSLGLF